MHFNASSFRIQVKFIKTANRHSNEKCAAISRKCNSIWYDTLLKSILVENLPFSLHLQICTLQKPKFQLKFEFKMYISISNSTNALELIFICYVSIKSIKIDWIGFSFRLFAFM